MMQGLPASGKTTKAKELMALSSGNTFRVNKDELRKMMFVGDWNYKKEKVIQKAEESIVRSLLESNRDVIVDDTNFGKHDYWQSIADTYGHKFRVNKVETPIGDCLTRDSIRKDQVGSHVIWSMAMRNGLWKAEKGVIICDIDGTVADLEHRKKYLPDWDKFFSLVSRDKPRHDIIQDVIDMQKYGYDIFFVSGRPERTRHKTIQWLLKKTGIDFVELFMRGDHDNRPDTEVKADILQIFQHQNIVKVFDDRPSVIRMWRSHGLNVIDCGDGIEF